MLMNVFTLASRGSRSPLKHFLPALLALSVLQGAEKTDRYKKLTQNTNI